jgi:hypothetical protein
MRTCTHVIRLFGAAGRAPHAWQNSQLFASGGTVAVTVHAVGTARTEPVYGPFTLIAALIAMQASLFPALSSCSERRGCVPVYGLRPGMPLAGMG